MTLKQLALSVCALIVPTTTQAALVTHYNFNAYQSSDTVIAPDSGMGGVTLDGWSPSQNELSVQSGTDINAVTGDVAGTALGLGNVNGATMTMQFSSTGFSDLTVSMAAHHPNSSYDNVALEWSLNGTDWNAVGSVMPNVNQFEIESFDLSGISQLNDQATAYLRFTFTGANENANTFTTIDNLRIDAAAGVPEAPAVAMMALASLLFAGLLYRSRRMATAAGGSAPAV